MLLRRTLIWFAACFAPITVVLAADCCSPEFADFRAAFVNRFEYSYNASSINTIMQNLANLGITDVMFQVRGRADAFYDSQYEPRAIGLPANFDPLQTAIDAAHSRGLKLHAWINTTNLWNSSTVTPPAGHPFYFTDPSFRLVDINGNFEPQQGYGGGYASVNPVLPEVHTHINNVVNDIATNYAVDGINLDYIRYVSGTGFDTLPHDATSHTMFTAATGLDGSNAANAAAYRNFVKGRITDLVAGIKSTVDAAEVAESRTMLLSANVWRDPDVGENDYMQDYRTWLENNYLDIAQPMIYLSSSNDNTYFSANLANSLNVPSNSRVAPTLGIYLHDADGGGVALTTAEMERTYNMGAGGMGFYGYSALFNDPLSASRRTAISNFYNSLDTLPNDTGNVLDNFETNEGHFGWAPTFSGSNVGILAGSTADRVTTEAQSGSASQQINVDGSESGWTLRFVSGIGSAADPAGNVALPSTGFLGFWLKTSDTGLTVQLALDDPGTADRSYLKAINPDGQWHLYQWNLEDDAEWSGWSGVGGDGSITNPTVTLDAIFFRGAGDATFYLDNVSHNPTGYLAATPVPGDYDQNGTVGPEDYTAWKNTFGQYVAPGSGADGNGDGLVDSADYSTWRDNLGAGSGAAAGSASSVPEPTSHALMWLALGVVGIHLIEVNGRDNR
jgi:uncharacterized lipoprotein YddW (UPF0748 family)